MTIRDLQATRGERQALRACFRIIRDPRRWTTHTLAQDAIGNGVSPTDVAAVRWCALGVIEHVDGEHQRAAESRLQDTASRVFHDTVVGVNDGYAGHRGVVHLFAAAIRATLPPNRLLKRRTYGRR
jgi:hypothetical protein